MKLVLAQCTGQKRETIEPAAELYAASSYFRAQRHYARTADKWAIQSAKHGLLWPHEEVAPYDTTISDLGDVDSWVASIADEIQENVSTDYRIDILGGKIYADPLTPELEARGFEVHEPLRGLRIGEHISKLNELAKSEVPA